MSSENTTEFDEMLREYFRDQKPRIFHRDQSSDCPAIPYLLTGLYSNWNGWPDSQVQHVAGCRFCQRSIDTALGERCPTPDLLDAYAKGQSPIANLVGAHLEQCQSCASRTAATEVPKELDHEVWETYSHLFAEKPEPTVYAERGYRSDNDPLGTVPAELLILEQRRPVTIQITDMPTLGTDGNLVVGLRLDGEAIPKGAYEIYVILRDGSQIKGDAIVSAGNEAVLSFEVPRAASDSLRNIGAIRFAELPFRFLLRPPGPVA